MGGLQKLEEEGSAFQEGPSPADVSTSAPVGPILDLYIQT